MVFKKLKDKIRKEYYRPEAEVAKAFGILYLTAVLAVNAIAFPIVTAFNGLERALGAEKHEFVATLDNKKSFWDHYGNKHIIGTFRTQMGDKKELYDNADILSGKFLAESELRFAETGKKYKVTSLEGPISFNVLDLEEIANK